MGTANLSRTAAFFIAQTRQSASTTRVRPFLLILVVLTFAFGLPAEDIHAPAPPKTGANAPLKIGTGEADQYYGQVMIVTGRVVQVTMRPKVKFLNLDQPFPNSPFTVVIFQGTYLADATALEGKDVEIKGKIKNYHDKPEIVLSDTNQLTVLGGLTVSTNAPATPPSTNAPPPTTDSTNLSEIL